MPTWQSSRGRPVRRARYEAAGASISADAVNDTDTVLKVRRPEAGELSRYKRGALTIAIMDPCGSDAALKAMAEAGVAASAMELMSRIVRAQVMDVLSSQANLAGYRAVIEAAEAFGRAFRSGRFPQNQSVHVRTIAGERWSD